MFVDRVRLHANSGNGGRGAVSFLREKFVPKGGPDGGDGGEGGDVVLIVDPQLNNLIDLRYRPHARAGHGGSGGGKQCTGRNGKDCLLKVPPGTVVYPLPPGEVGDPLVDLTNPGEKFVLCKGGAGVAEIPASLPRLGKPLGTQKMAVRAKPVSSFLSLSRSRKSVWLGFLTQENRASWPLSPLHGPKSHPTLSPLLPPTSESSARPKKHVLP